MSTRERAYNLLNVMTEDDLQMFIDIFGRIYSSPLLLYTMYQDELLTGTYDYPEEA